MFALRSWTIEQDDRRATITIQESRFLDTMVITINDRTDESKISLSREAWDALVSSTHDFRWASSAPEYLPNAPLFRPCIEDQIAAP